MTQPDYMILLRSSVNDESAVGYGLRAADALDVACRRFIRNWGQLRVARVEIYQWRCDAATPSGRWCDLLHHTFRVPRAINIYLKETVVEMTQRACYFVHDAARESLSS